MNTIWRGLGRISNEFSQPIMASNSAVEIDNESDNSSGSSLFKTQCVPYSPKQGQRNPIRKFVRSSGGVEARDSSSDSSFEPRPLTLKAIFERFKKKRNVKRGNIS